MNFINRLDLLLEQKDISAHRMSLDLKLNKNAVSNWRTRGNLPNSDALLLIADYLGVSTDYLLGRTDNPSPGTVHPALRLFAHLSPADQSHTMAYMQFLYARALDDGGELTQKEMNDIADQIDALEAQDKSF